MDTHNQHGCLSFYTQVQHTVAYGPRYGRPQTVIIKSSVVISLWGFRAKQWIIQSNISPSPQHTHTHTHTHTIIITATSMCTLLGQAAAEKIFPVDILCFWPNIDFRGKAAGGLLVTFHITLEIYAELSTCASGWGGGERDAEKAEMDGWMDGLTDG